MKRKKLIMFLIVMCVFAFCCFAVPLVYIYSSSHSPIKKDGPVKKDYCYKIYKVKQVSDHSYLVEVEKAHYGLTKNDANKELSLIKCFSELTE